MKATGGTLFKRHISALEPPWRYIISPPFTVGAEWGAVSWTSSEPATSSIAVTAASSADCVSFGASEAVTDGDDLSVADRQCLKVVASWTKASTGETPILFDLTITTASGGGFTTAKDVSDIRCGILDNVLVVVLTGAYPSIDYYCDIDIYSLGSIPVHIESLEYWTPAVEPIGSVGLPASTTVEIIGSETWLGSQLHAGDEVLGTLHVHLDNDAEENKGAYIFNATNALCACRDGRRRPE